MKPSRMLLVQLADIGDLIVTTPAIAALREAHPDAHLALLTSAHAAPVIESTGLVDEVLVMDRGIFAGGMRALLSPARLAEALRMMRRLRRGRYDTLVFFRHFSTRAGAFKHAAIALSAGSKRRVGLRNANAFFLTESLVDDGFGAQPEAQHWLNVAALLGADASHRPAQVAADESYLPDGFQPDGGPLVILHGGSGGLNRARRWDVAHFAAVGDSLHQRHNAQIVLVGGPHDDAGAMAGAMRAPSLNLAGQTTLPQLAGLLKRADLFIGADSGIMHLAAAVNAPMVAIFGPTTNAAWGPWTPGQDTPVLRSAPRCSPCSYVEHAVGLREGCAARTCMRMVTVEAVLAAAEARLTGQSYTPPAPVPLPPTTRSWPRVQILGLPVDGITYAQWLDQIGAWIAAHRRQPGAQQAAHICTTNPEFTMIAQRDANFYNILSRADLCVPDGVGLLWAARRLGQPLPERVTGSDGVPRIAERAAREGWRLFLLGAAPGVADKTAQILQERYPGLQIAGVYSGSPAPEEEDDIVARVNASDADVLFVAYGAPRQDKWIARNLPRLNVAVAMGVGGSFDFIAGVMPRAPLWMQRAGIEWLYRLMRQPTRIGRMMRLPRFVLAVLRRGSRPPQPIPSNLLDHH